MVAATKKFPVTLAERAALGEKPQFFPGSFEDFVKFAEKCDYPVEFDNGTIVAMSIASDLHERIVANLLYVMVGLFKGNRNFKSYGSNRHVFSKKDNRAFSPDASVVKGEPEKFDYKKGKNAITNPWLLVEVLSKSTRRRDLGEKFPIFKKMPSVKYILFVEQDEFLVTLWQKNKGRWSSMEYNQLDQSFEIEGKTVLMEDIYDNIYS